MLLYTDATTMPKTTSLIDKLATDFPDFTFEQGADFMWSPTTHTVFYTNTANTPQLFHELAHGILDHTGFRRDIELLSMEVAAWKNAKEIAQRYGVVIDDAAAEDHLDTYREWMHARSTCPNCEAVGVQSGETTYSCVACQHEWQVNDARHCGLKRYSLTHKTSP